MMERGADLHMAQLMPLPLTVSCFSEIQIGFTLLVPADPGSPGQRAVKRQRKTASLLSRKRVLVCSRSMKWSELTYIGVAMIFDWGVLQMTSLQHELFLVGLDWGSPRTPRTPPPGYAHVDVHTFMQLMSACRRL